MSENNVSEKKIKIRKEKHPLVKNCPHCGKKLKMEVVKTAEQKNKFLNFLIKTLSPGGVNINQRYKCPRCFHEFDDMSFAEAVLVPLILIGVVILSVVLFIIFVFYAVA